jgi:hypothetical protein
MSFVSKRVTSSHYRIGCRFAVSLVALLVSVPCVKAAIPALSPPQPVVTAPPANHFGVALTITELSDTAGSAGWLFTVADTNTLVSLLEAVETLKEHGASSVAARDTKQAPTGNMLALNGPISRAMLEVTTAPGTQLAAFDSYSQATEVTNRVLQTQNAAVAFDTSLRYLCADKLYSDLYPNGKGWNNHTYSECRPGGALDIDRPASTLTALVVGAGQPPGDPGTGFVNIPCGGSIANISSMTIGSPASAATPLASLSALSQLGRGQR